MFIYNIDYLFVAIHQSSRINYLLLFILRYSSWTFPSLDSSSLPLADSLKSMSYPERASFYIEFVSFIFLIIILTELIQVALAIYSGQLFFNFLSLSINDNSYNLFLKVSFSKSLILSLSTVL